MTTAAMTVAPQSRMLQNLCTVQLRSLAAVWRPVVVRVCKIVGAQPQHLCVNTF
jgi:hypothetical protein